MRDKLKGFYVVAQTPFTPSGALDFDSIDLLCSFYLKHGVDGFTVLGVSGEAGKLTPVEAVEVAARYVASSHGRPVIAGVSSSSVAQLTQITKEVVSEGASGVMISPPSSVQTDEELFAYFEAVFARIGDVPTVLQDFPSASGVRMSVLAIVKLFELFPQFCGLKEEDLPSVSKITKLRQASSQHIPILTGNNGLYLPQELSRGADGPMAGFSYPEMLSGVYKLMMAGEQAQALDCFDTYLPLLRYEAQGPWGVAARKEVMRRRGALNCSAMRQPGPLLSETDMAEITTLIDRLEKALA